MKVMTKFNYKRGSGTRKGKVAHLRELTRDHALYRFYFTKSGGRRSNEETKRLLAIARHQTTDILKKEGE